MKVVAINGSARKDGNTAILIKHALAALQEQGIATEMLQMAGKTLAGCRACGWCAKNKNNRCVIDDDDLNMYLERIITADGIILGSPTYFADVSSQMKALIDRIGYVARNNGHSLRYKVGAAVIAVRRGGAIHAFDTINHFFQISHMFIPGTDYWNVGIGRSIGEVENDAEGMGTMKNLGINMGYLLRKLKQ
ncbi:MAG: flavodoxin family protein [Deltaproteobacteria bacterium]|nr:flavodoxin family protein [Deltaproteobacteria bacterium]